MVKAGLRSLERMLVKERATLAVHDFVDEIGRRWQQVLDDERSGDTVIDLVSELLDDNIGIPTLPIAINYLEKCLRERRHPDPTSLTSMMAPWTRRRFK